MVERKLSEHEIARIRKFQRANPPNTHKPTLEELFNPLIQQHTQFNDIFEFFAAGGFDVKTAKDIDPIKDKLNAYIKKTQPGLHNWDNMLYGALKAYGEKVSKK